MDSHQPRYSAEESVDPTILVIRADANTAIGSGHVMRCLALAQAWQDQGGAVTFVSDVSTSLRERLRSEGIAVRPVTAEPGSAADAEYLIETARELGARHVVVDGYHFGAVYPKQLKDARLHVLFLDDNGHAKHYYADLVLNQNIHDSEDLYPSREPYTRLLLGTRYALLRREFQPWQNWRREISDTGWNVLVTMGGSDPDNVTLKVLRALERARPERVDVRVVVGSGNPHFAELEKAARHLTHTVRLEQNTTDMPALMAWADVAVSAAGSTCWELAFMGLPSIVLVVAENQQAIAANLTQRDAAISLGQAVDTSQDSIASAVLDLLYDTNARRRLSKRGRSLVDGRGAARAVAALQQTRLHLRSATIDDCRLVFDWANEPATRQASFSSEPIAWDTHAAWFEQILMDGHTLLWIATDQSGRPIGQVRFVLQNHEATISIGLDPAHRGRGYGTALIEQASGVLLDSYGTKVVHAYIKPGNIASEQAFARAGYSHAAPTEMHNQVALHMRLEKP